MMALMVLMVLSDCPRRAQRFRRTHCHCRSCHLRGGWVRGPAPRVPLRDGQVTDSGFLEVRRADLIARVPRAASACPVPRAGGAPDDAQALLCCLQAAGGAASSLYCRAARGCGSSCPPETAWKPEEAAWAVPASSALAVCVWCVAAVPRRPVGAEAGHRAGGRA